ncbi:MAG: hypothetical protein HKM94_01660 [Halobacteria archaeon]|nr:hypothetical protein [Halobacteria archaeon]
MKKSLLLLLLILVAIGIAYYIVTNSKSEQKPRRALSLMDLNCNPDKVVCVAADQDYSITLYFPEQVHYLRPFRMQVTTKGFSKTAIKAVNVEYTMVGMDMGLNRFTLSSVIDEKGDVSYQGEGILPVCVSGRVDWLANVHIITAEKVYEAVFKLVVTK